MLRKKNQQLTLQDWRNGHRRSGTRFHRGCSLCQRQLQRSYRISCVQHCCDFFWNRKNLLCLEIQRTEFWMGRLGHISNRCGTICMEQAGDFPLGNRYYLDFAIFWNCYTSYLQSSKIFLCCCAIDLCRNSSVGTYLRDLAFFMKSNFQEIRL